MMSHGAIAGWLGALMTLRRLRGRAALLVAASTVAFTTLAAYAERRTLAAEAATRTLQGAVFGLAIPIATLSLVALALSHARLDDAQNAATLLGANRRTAAAGSLMAVGVLAAVLGGIVALSASLVAHGQMRPASIHDAFTSCWIGMLTAAAYTALLAAASTFGARGGGRPIVLVIDLVLGAMMGPATIVLPRAHALQLLGVAPASTPWPQPASSALLIGLTLLYALIALRRVQP